MHFPLFLLVVKIYLYFSLPNFIILKVSLQKLTLFFVRSLVMIYTLYVDLCVLLVSFLKFFKHNNINLTITINLFSQMEPIVALLSHGKSGIWNKKVILLAIVFAIVFPISLFSNLSALKHTSILRYNNSVYCYLL